MGSSTSGIQPPVAIRNALSSNLDALGVVDRALTATDEQREALCEVQGYLRRSNTFIVKAGWPRESATLSLDPPPDGAEPANGQVVASILRAIADAISGDGSPVMLWVSPNAARVRPQEAV